MNPSKALKIYLLKTARNGAPSTILFAQFALFTAILFVRETSLYAEHDSTGIKTALSYHVSAVLVSNSRRWSQFGFIRGRCGSIVNTIANITCLMLAIFFEKFYEKSLSSLGFVLSIAALFLLLLVVIRPSTDLGFFSFLIGVIGSVAYGLYRLESGTWIVVGICSLLLGLKCWLDKNWLEVEEDQSLPTTTRQGIIQISNSEIMEAVTVAGFFLVLEYDLFRINCLHINRQQDSISYTPSSIMGMLLCVVIVCSWFILTLIPRVYPPLRINWWNECGEEEFREAFRMGKSTFDMICEELNSVLANEDTTLRNAMTVKQRVTVCIWWLVTGEPLRLVSKRFGLEISTCHKLVLEVCTAMRTVLMPKYLQWPDEDALMKIKDEFESVSGVPNVVGSLYTTHIPIIAPEISASAYFNKRHTERNQKSSYSIIVQGVVDPRGVFTDVCIGWPGSMDDGQVLEKSALYQRANGGLLKNGWIVGNSGYPLLDWVLVPYTLQNLTGTQHAFNEKIGEIQRVAKDAFARLKGRWSCLQKITEVKLQDLLVVLGACCVLHNICEVRNEEMDPKLRIELLDDEVIPEIPLRSVNSMVARDHIAHYLLHHGLAVASFL